MSPRLERLTLAPSLVVACVVSDAESDNAVFRRPSPTGASGGDEAMQARELSPAQKRVASDLQAAIGTQRSVDMRLPASLARACQHAAQECDWAHSMLMPAHGAARLTASAGCAVQQHARAPSPGVAVTRFRRAVSFILWHSAWLCFCRERQEGQSGGERGQGLFMGTQNACYTD